MKHWLNTLKGMGIFIILWGLISLSGLIDSFLFPGPFETISKLGELLYSGVIFKDITATVFRLFGTIGIVIGVGVPFGLFLGMHERVYRSVEFIIDFFRSLPATALFPVFLLFFGVEDASKIAAATVGSLAIVVFNTAYGVMHSKKSRILAAQTMGATKSQISRFIVFWESLPQMIVGLRLGISYSLIVIIVTEMVIGTTIGLGKRIMDFQITYEIAAMYATILFTGILGYTLNLLLVTLEKRVIHWSGK